MGLQEYKRKRNFSVTPEPAGKVHPQPGSSFVIQKHAATRLHYDFRLELDGVLKSWAVPKGPSLDPGEKRLAVHVEDHPLEYGDFEGIIPKGQYGGGTVLVWDQGTWSPEGDADAVKAYRKGHLKFQLEGEKLHGGWNLVRMHGPQAGENKENWLLIKENDEYAVPGSADAVVREYPASAATGRTLEEIAADPDRVWRSNREEKVDKRAAKAPVKAKAKAKPANAEAVSPAKIHGARKGRLPGAIEPQLATLVDEPPQGAEWVHEMKFDGYRVLCEMRDGKVHIRTRHGKDWTARFSPVAEAVAQLPVRSALLDGEVAVLEPDGTTSFQALQNALTGDREHDLVYFAFDLLYLDGYDLRGATLLDRKAALAGVLSGNASPTIRFSDHVEGSGEAFFRQACSHSLEGIVCKRGDLPYRSGRTKEWLKVKCLKRQEFVIVGFTDPEGSRTGFGALLLGVHDDQGELVFAGKVGTGFNDQLLRDLCKRLEKIERKTPAFENPPRGAEARRSHWVKPELVGEVAFTEWTREDILRHPTFQGLREDKEAGEVVREDPHPLTPSPKNSSKKRGAGVGKEVKSEFAGVKLSHPDKVLFPEQGVTKGELAEYYEQIADWILPRIADRPLTLVRCPEGRARQCFYQKHVNEHFPKAVKRIQVEEEAGSEPYGTIDSAEGLLSLVQAGVLEMHIWGSTRKDIEKPDYVVFDLDPDEGLAWERVVEGALLLRDRLGDLGLRSFLKTTGGKGLHVCAPLTRRAGWDEVKAFTKAVSESVVAEDPEHYTSKLPKASRKGKIFIDYLRNGRGATSICAYSTRARAGAPVSTPLFWEEIESGQEVRGAHWNVRNLPERLESLKSDPWEEFSKIRQSITAAMRKAVGMK
ncbi:MAG TPA: DNA ligase D [Thermoanaerobaculia bacterium]|nr:DNA ligase D [Thermoanaerobaculia bacterium]